MVLMVEMLEKVEIPPVADPMEFSPSIFDGSVIVWCFGISTALSS
jgi:hypothetical protein